MPTSRAFAALLLLALLPVAVPAAHTPSKHCGGPEPRLGIVEATSGVADATIYIDDRNHVLGNGVWLYQETNGIWTARGPGVFVGEKTYPNHDVTAHNLQRGGSNPIFPSPPPSVPMSEPELCVDDPHLPTDTLWI